jgi:hypothetical protein
MKETRKKDQVFRSLEEMNKRFFPKDSRKIEIRGPEDAKALGTLWARDTKKKVRAMLFAEGKAA